MGIKGRGGKPKGQRTYSDRDWKPKKDATLRRMIAQGFDYDVIGSELGRRRLGMMQARGECAPA